ncbi:TPR repeat-containing protein [Biomphalaria glabrata]
MGRKKTKNVSKNRSNSTKVNEPKKASKPSISREHQTANDHPIDKLLDKAEQLIDEFNYELAQKFCQRALEKDPDNLRGLETSASLLIELGNVESAKHCLGRAIELCPHSGFTKYMMMGQLLEGSSAVECYQKGIEIMLKEKEEKETLEVAAACKNDRDVTNKDISSAYCAIAEIYLTDCCFDDTAENKCKEFTDKALEADPDNAEALQIKASYHLSKDEIEEAKELIKKSVSLWLPKLEAADTGNVADEEFDPVDTCPLAYNARVQCGKILIEVEDYELATDVLETLLDEDDEVPDVWYLIGWANYLQGQEFYSNARHYLLKGKEVYVKVKYDDAGLLTHIEELLTELGPEPEESESVEPLEIESSEEEDMDH